MAILNGLKLLRANGGRFEINQLLFADDTSIVADSEEKLCRLVSEFGRICKRRKFKINVLIKCYDPSPSRRGSHDKLDNASTINYQIYTPWPYTGPFCPFYRLPQPHQVTEPTTRQVIKQPEGERVVLKDTESKQKWVHETQSSYICTRLLHSFLPIFRIGHLPTTSTT